MYHVGSHVQPAEYVFDVEKTKSLPYGDGDEIPRHSAGACSSVFGVPCRVTGRRG